MIGSRCFVLVAVVCYELQSVISFSHRKSNYTQNYSTSNRSENVRTSNNNSDNGHDYRYNQDPYIQLYSGPEKLHSLNDGGQFGGKVKQNDFLHTSQHSHIDNRHRHVHRSERDQDTSNSSSSEEGFVRNEASDFSRTMYFPSDEHPTKSVRKKDKQPCQHGICEDVDDYPAEKIVEVISRSKELVGFFRNQPKPFGIDNRFGEDSDDDTPCPTMKTKKFPKKALSTRNVEQLIVNVNDFQQGVDLEICKNEGSSCKFAEFPPHSYTTKCKQKYSKRLLMTFNEGKNDTIFDTFEFPSCCVCNIHRST